ncbi:aldose epimerase family protein [Oharaeibacter diazotrophicus]|uniref:Aldose 1-epimerase n=1 Tax=Oharaeibacter diazotrophicus TaxID=1920512 RepID=A0A4V3CVY7_9HYPH|nr:aldose epimerase family protein [Oharaeibacter diazotrophicus]TDP84258.1 aldose 1-epimerase [Oharaeibacter diazotrophicus]BBE73295.1 aldose 1-epimerase precursor [Pleomorphomonas sp. SM30]GLS75086.1 aldose 1-epimerase [Oharaeibacter diazotrophicus]
MAVAGTGVVHDGREIETVALAGGGLSATVLTLGATLADLVVETAQGPRRLLLGFDRVERFVTQAAYLGAIAGRCANRIRAGRCTIDGRAVALSINDGPNHLHGGTIGFGKRVWRIADATADAVELSLVSPDGEEGYPGRVEARCRYTLGGDGTLTIALAATTDAPTLVNLAAHGYFALDDGPTVLDHRLVVAADRYTPAGDDLLPTGEILPVAGTRFDFRAERAVRNGPDGAHVPYDTNLVLADAPSATPRFAARLSSPASGVALELSTTEPGLQVYDGGFLPVPEPLAGGRPGVRFGGICLEPQRFPDAVNHPNFAGALLRPGETCRQTTVYRINTDG